MPLVAQTDYNRITEAIDRAEHKTSGEIVTVIALESSAYLYAPFVWAALIALLVPWPFIYFTWLAVQWIYVIQLVVFFLLLACFLPRPIRYWLVPRSVKDQRAHRRAVDQFLVQNLHTTKGRTGVMIFVSVAERYAEIIADSEINTKVDKGTWQSIVDRLTADISAAKPADGLIRAIEACGEQLAKHFPPGQFDPNELPNHLIILENETA
jgi:putative membrane protein